MKFQRRFYNDSVNFKGIPVERIVIAIIIGLISALTIYGFFYVLRETFRVMSFGFEQIPNILSESDRNFYNLFFAGLSVVFGNSITVLYIFSRPNVILSRFNPKLRRILNDQIFLNFNFSYWFTKIGLVFGVFSMCCMRFDFLPYFKTLSYLLLFVLALESWKGLATLFSKTRIKWQFFHLILLFFLTLGLSKIDVVNYKSIDKALLKNNPIINLPQSDYYNYKYNWRNPLLKFKVELNEYNKLDIYTEGRVRIGLNNLASTILLERASLREELIPFLVIIISANKDLDLKYIKMIESELYLVNQHRIIYDVYNDDLKFNRFEMRGIEKRISPFVLEYREFYENSPLPISPHLLPENRIEFVDTLKVRIGKDILVKDTKVERNKLKNKFIYYVKNKTALEYIYNENTKYQDYITVLSSHYKAANELREKEQTIFRQNEYSYDEAYREEQYKLKKKYPIYIIETLTP